MTIGHLADSIRIAIIQFPGSNCERETSLAVKRAQMTPISFLWNQDLTQLRTCAGYILVGGFSYEDRSRAGIIAALDPVIAVLKQESARGKPVLGICNGAQILVEAGLVPGIVDEQTALALCENKRIANEEVVGTGYYNAWVYVRLAENYQRNAFTRYLSANNVIRLPVAHGEGRFVISAALRTELIAQGLYIFQYCDQVGKISADFPINPNGSLDNVAAIANKAGNVMAIMPHPERTPTADPIFYSMRDYIKDGHLVAPNYLSYYPRAKKRNSYRPQAASQELIIGLTITDNHALSVQATLAKLGFAVTVRRFVHWELSGTAPIELTTILSTLTQSNLLYNPSKEYISSRQPMLNSDSFVVLVRAHDDIIGRKKTQDLHKHFQIPGLNQIIHSIIWQFQPTNPALNFTKSEFEQLLVTNIIHNSFSHECYDYK